MSANTPLERTIASWMASEATGRVPDRLADDVIAITSRQRPWPRWIAILKEPPMHLEARVAVGSPTRRIAFALALLMLLLAATTIAVGALVNHGPAPASDDWPGFRGDAARSGVGVTGPIGLPVQRWRYRAAGAVNSAIAVVGDVVFASSDDGLLHALALADGSERWTFRADQSPILGPTVANGVVYAVDGSNRMVALDAATGKEHWRSDASIVGSTTASVGDGRIYVGSADGSLVALDAASGKESWRATVSSGSSAGTPSYADGLVFDAGSDAGLTAFDATTGARVWHVDTGTDQVGTAVVSGGVVYIGASADATTGHLRALDAKTGRLLWMVAENLQAPAVAGQVAYTSSKSGHVVALGVADGREQWSFHVSGTTRAPVVAAGVVYVMADDEHRLYALDAASGAFLWRYDVDSSNECCIAVAKGSVFLGTVLGSVYDIGGDGSTLAAGPAPTAAIPASVAPSNGSATAASGSQPPAPVSLLWQSTGGPDGVFLPNMMSRDPAGDLWVADPYNDRFAIFKPDGTFVEYWGTAGSDQGKFDLKRSNGDGYGSIAFASDGSFYVLDVGNRRVQVFDSKRQFVRSWGTFGTGPGEYVDPVGIAVGPDGTVHVLDDVRGVIESYDPSGKVLNSFDAFVHSNAGFNTANALAVDAKGNLYVSDIQPFQVERFDATGKLTMTYGSGGKGPGQFSDQPGAMVVDAGGRLFVNQGSGRTASAAAIQVFDRDGRFLLGFGTSNPGEDQLSWPTGMLLDGTGVLYVGDAAGLADNSVKSSLKAFRLLAPLAP